MMLVLEVVTTALLLLAGATAQKPTTLGEDASSLPAAVTENGPLFDALSNSAENHSTDEAAFTREEVFGKGLDSEENSEYDVEIEDDYNDDEEDDDDDDDDDFEDDEDDDWTNSDAYQEDMDDLDLDALHEIYGEEETRAEDDDEVEDEDSKERFKRKIIYRGQGGGGIYSRGGRRGQGGGGDEDPYGRRRDHYGGGPSDSWPYRSQDSRDQSAGQMTPSTTGGSSTAGKAETGAAGAIYGTPRKTEADGGAAVRSPSGGGAAAGSSTSNSSGRNSGKRTKTERRETSSKSKLSKNLKHEIAQYAMRHGPQNAAEHFQERVGRKLKVKKIEKFIRRYQERQ
ncbi:aspartate and glycine-rich protein-like [Macrobrachium nipponense]|uniref:aspartate and glycine-rich protein-like n=1 Tax=Macrobrachium nipponense TaxID=159736 RepID=UPI0030C8261B